MALLKGLKILDFSSMIAGPYTTMMFADLGADVIHVESSNRLDLMRIMPPYNEQKESYIYQQLHRNKQSLSLQLKSPEAIAIIHELIQQYDIILESFSPGVMKSLELDYDSLKKINPSIIYCSITGYGQTGPYTNRAGYDLNYLATSGVAHFTRHDQGKPVATGLQMSDIAGGAMHAATAILAAVYQRTQSDQGQYIDVSLLDTTFSMNTLFGASYLGNNKVPNPSEDIFNGGTFYDYYETKDGRYFSVASMERPYRQQLCEVLGIPEIIDHTFNESSYTQKRFKEAIADSFKTRTFDEWLEYFDESFNGCVEPVLTIDEAMNHPQVKARELIVDVPQNDGTTIRQIGHPLKFSTVAPRYDYPALNIGASTDDILSKIGYTTEKIEQLHKNGILD